MRRLSVWIVSLLVVAIVTGCGGAHRYDQRLIAADSLMLSAPDSALALLTPICGDSLPTDGDRAYRGLLLTQARYKCYEKITADDDSAITLAMDYYRTHDGEREKLTRAYLYKGAVMEELAHVDSAMLYYKTAEAVADEKDYFTLGYVNMRMGALYRDHYSLDGKDIINYETAYHYLKLTDNKHYLLVCMINLGSLNRLNDPEKADIMLHDAMSLAREMNDTTNYLACAKNLLAMYEHYGMYPQAKKIIHHTLSYPQDRIGGTFYTDAAKVYAHLDMMDSALYFLKLSENKSFNGPLDELSRLDCLSELAKAQGQQLKHLQYEQQCRHLADSLKKIQETVKILNSEHEFDQVAKSAVKSQHRLTIIWLISLCLLILLILTVVFYRRTHRYDHIIADFKQQSASQLNDLSVLKQNIDKLQIQDDQLKSFISNHLNMTSEMIEACYHEPKSKLSHQVKRIVEFQHDNEHRWIQLFHYIDAEYNQIISKTRKAYPQLHDRDLLLIALTCMRFSQIQIAIILGYANATSISTVKFRLAQKMCLDCPLNDYINRIISASDSSM